ncbi:Rdd [Candidatus Koribacter versatilis Ellin345]|uniref:Rdd n=1 Tax=Koribacter versatilis (strain Ellin345) TaxID=204669 RepID=Q1IVD4_KORVE|nr:RDD family protein [Candidatus Koribacter versatilis]ABF39166.1 Rdd [Candidatus Koribacter versatilis Ellin345]
MDESLPLDESWKSEVASRLDSYRSKSKRKLSGDFSMRFNFEGELARPRQQICVPAAPKSETVEPDAEEQAAETLELSVVAKVEAEQQVIEEKVQLEQVELPQTVPPSQPPPLRPSVPFKRKIRMEANVIEFPRLFPPEPPLSNVLAEPVLPSAPRILDAPEIAEPLWETPILEGMRLEHIEHESAPQFELPLQVASVIQRVNAYVADGLIVLIASAVFCAVVLKLLPGLELSKPLIFGAAAVPPIFWATFEYLFIVYAARTPGMAMTKLALSTFDGTAPNRRQRHRRVLGMAVSCCSLMLGFLWAFFDEDMLCWHDRMSRTYSFHQKS